MKPNAKLTLALAALAALAIVEPAHAGSKIEKVDMVAEGIDLKTADVRANSTGYTTYANSSHNYIVRLFAKAKGANRVWWVGLDGSGANILEVGSGYYFQQSAGKSEGWGVYKKSVVIPVNFNHTTWFVSPKQACTNNMNAKIAGGMTKANVLSHQWGTVAKATLYFNAQADTKGHNKNNDHNPNSSDGGTKVISYPVNVVCRAAT
jgi:hypothetical protein